MDRFYRGFVSGVVAGIPLNAWSLFSFYILKLADIRMLDWAGMIIYGNLPKTLLQATTALVMQLVWAGFLGIVFVNLIRDTTSQGYVGKAVIYSLMLGFLESGIVVLYKVPHLAGATVYTALSTHIGAVIWGLFLAYFSRRWDQTPERS